MLVNLSLIFNKTYGKNNKNHIHEIFLFIILYLLYFYIYCAYSPKISENKLRSG